MDFYAILDQVIDLLKQRGRASYRALQRQFALDDDYLTDLKEAILFAHPQVRDEEGRGLVWTGDAGPAATATRLGRLSWLVATYYAGINTSKMCSQLWPWANSCSTSLSRLCNASRAIVRTRCPMVMSPCANANLSVSDPDAGACWSNDCATQLKRKWRLTAASLRT